MQGSGHPVLGSSNSSRLSCGLMTGTRQALGGEEAWMEHDVQNTQGLRGLTILCLWIKKLFTPKPGQCTTEMQTVWASPGGEISRIWVIDRGLGGHCICEPHWLTRGMPILFQKIFSGPLVWVRAPSSGLPQPGCPLGTLSPSRPATLGMFAES